MAVGVKVRVAVGVKVAVEVAVGVKVMVGVGVSVANHPEMVWPTWQAARNNVSKQTTEIANTFTAGNRFFTMLPYLNTPGSTLRQASPSVACS